MMCHGGNIEAVLESWDGKYVPSVLGRLQREPSVVPVAEYEPTSLCLPYVGQTLETDLAMQQRVRKYPMGSG